MSQDAPLPQPTRNIMGTLVVSLALLILAGGWIIPFRYESFSILYKFGTEKTYLRVGKMAGISLVLLVFYQIVLASRFAALERIFSVKSIFFLHRINGMVIACLAVLHPLLIKAAENFIPYTFEEKYYPEFLGMGLFCIILALSGDAIFRMFLQTTYSRWRLLHRLGATMALGVMPAHVLWVSETFKSGPPRTAALVIFSLALLLAARVWLRTITAKR